MQRAKIFLICCIAFIVGVAVASFLPANLISHDLGWFIGIVISAIALALFFENKKIIFIGLIGLFLFFGLWRYALSLPLNAPDKIWYYNGQTVNIRGAVCNEPDVRESNQKLEICVENIKLDFANQPNVNLVTGKILVTTSLYPSYAYGDRLEVKCELKAPEEFSGFSYDRYLARYDIYSVCYYPNINKLSEKKTRGIYKSIFTFKNKLRDLVNYGLPEPEASLAKAIVLGDKKNIPSQLRENFSQAGVSHIIAISGMHISIIAALLMALLLGLGLSRQKSFWLASIFLLLYIVLVGLPASAMRAGLMGFLVLWALNLGRLNKITNSLVLAAAVLLLINPKLLRDDIGFQLSFLAVLGIVYYYPILNTGFEKIKIPKLKGIRDIIGITIAAQILTLPIIAFNFSLASLISPVSNLLVLWTLPFLMVAVLGALFFSLILPTFSFLFFLPANFLLKYIIIVAEQLVRLPYAYIEVDYLWWGWAVAYYIIAGWIILKLRAKRNV